MSILKDMKEGFKMYLEMKEFKSILMFRYNQRRKYRISKMKHKPYEIKKLPLKNNRYSVKIEENPAKGQVKSGSGLRQSPPPPPRPLKTKELIEDRVVDTVLGTIKNKISIEKKIKEYIDIKVNKKNYSYNDTFIDNFKITSFVAYEACYDRTRIELNIKSKFNYNKEIFYNNSELFDDDFKSQLDKQYNNLLESFFNSHSNTYLYASKNISFDEFISLQKYYDLDGIKYLDEHRLNSYRKPNKYYEVVNINILTDSIFARTIVEKPIGDGDGHCTNVLFLDGKKYINNYEYKFKRKDSDGESARIGLNIHFVREFNELKCKL